MGLKKQFVSAILLGSALTAPLFAQDIATPSSSIDTLAIFSFNDFHGAFASDGITPGAARLVQMTQNEKQRYPHSIVVSGTDGIVFILAALFVITIDAIIKKTWKSPMPVLFSFIPALLWILFEKLANLYAESIAILHPYWDADKAGIIIL